MQRAILNSTRIRGKYKQKLQNVVSLSVSNYSRNPMIITIGDVEETVPGYDEANQYARVFTISGDHTLFDIELAIDTPLGAGNAVLRYKTAVITNPNQC